MGVQQCNVAINFSLFSAVFPNSFLEGLRYQFPLESAECPDSTHKLSSAGSHLVLIEHPPPAPASPARETSVVGPLDVRPRTSSAGHASGGLPHLSVVGGGMLSHGQAPCGKKIISFCVFRTLHKPEPADWGFWTWLGLFFSSQRLTRLD